MNTPATRTMKAVGYRANLPIEHADALVDFEAPVPQAQGHDLLVAVRAVSVNPVDTKVRRLAAPAEGQTRVLGWDAVGVVEAVGEAVTRFKVGDRVWYAGDIRRPGSNAEYQLVDERIVGHAPSLASDAEAAALPLTTITAWELLFDRLGVPRDGGEGDQLLIVGAAGGVGSILTQLARRLTRLTIIGTASRPETHEWVTQLGAHHVVDHSQPLAAALKAIAPGGVRYIASLTQTDRHFAQLVEALAPQGQIAIIDDPEPIDVRLLKSKSAALHWELMFTRSTCGTPDMIEQGRLLDEAARLIDVGVLRTTVSERYGRIDAANLRRAHALIESGRARGKIVLEGF